MIRHITKFCIKFRWLVVAIWIIAVASIFVFAPNLSEVVKSDQASFLPKNSETAKASNMIKQLFPEKGGKSSMVLVMQRTGGLKNQDRAYAKEITDFIEQNTKTYKLREIVSPFRKPSLEKYLMNKEKDIGLVYFNLTTVPYTSSATDVVRQMLSLLGKGDSELIEGDIEKTFKAPDGLKVYWTGDAAIAYEEHESVNKSMDLTVRVTIFMVLGILLIIYRSPVAAILPMVAIGLSYLISKGLVAIAATQGFSVSTFTDTFLIAVLFGAGTDYCLLITSRFKEELSKGKDKRTALLDSMDNTGIAVLSSGGTVMVGFFCMIFAKFGLFNSTGPSVAIGVAITLISVITLVPALIFILGNALFWPDKKSHIKSNTLINRIWISIADRVTTRPIRIILLTLLAILPFIVMTNFTKTSFDQIKDLPSNNGSVIGYQIMSKGFAQGELMPIKIVIKSDKNFWESENLKLLDELCDNLTRIKNVDLVRTASRPSGEKLTEATLKSQMDEMSKGVTKIDDGIKPLYDGLIKIQKNTKKIADGLKTGSDGFAKMSDALVQSADGLKKTMDAINKLEAGTKASADGLNKTGAGLAELAKAINDAKAGIEQSVAALGNAELAMNGLLQKKPELATDMSFMGALQIVSGVKASLPQINGGLDQISDGLNKSASAVNSVSSGLGEIGAGMNSTSDGISTIENGVDKIGTAQQKAGKDIKTAGDGLLKLSDGVGKAAKGLDKLGDGISKLDTGIKDNYKGSNALDSVFYLPDSAIQDSKELRDALGEYISEDGKGVFLDVVLNVPPYSSAALDIVGKIKEVTEFTLTNTGLEKAVFHVGGTSVAMSEVRDLIARDFVIVMFSVLLGIFIVLCIMLRSLIAPVYLIFTILISYGCTMGISVLVFQYFGGGDGLHWAVPFFSFCVLVALGVDYNIFLMSRVKEEYRPGETRKGVAVALASTGGIITSCGIIMAGTFGAMLVSPVRPIIQIGFTAVVGLLIDTFIIRTLLVPAIAVKFGELNWWPGRKVKVVPHDHEA